MEKFRKFSILLRGFAPFVSEIRYEKGEEDLELSFSLQGKELAAKDLSFKRGSATPRLTIIVAANKENEQ